MTDKDLPRLFDSEYAIDKGTEYLLMIKSYLGTLLPNKPKEAWGMIVMSYNSGMGYMQKALQNLKKKNVFEPTLAQAVQEMQSSGFGKTPIFAVTVPYADRIVSGVKSFATTAAAIASAAVSVAGKAVKKPAIQVSGGVLLLGAIVILYFITQKKRRLT
jgi:hypothetical protein